MAEIVWWNTEVPGNNELCTCWTTFPVAWGEGGAAAQMGQQDSCNGNFCFFCNEQVSVMPMQCITQSPSHILIHFFIFTFWGALPTFIFLSAGGWPNPPGPSPHQASGGGQRDRCLPPQPRPALYRGPGCGDGEPLSQALTGAYALQLTAAQRDFPPAAQRLSPELRRHQFIHRLSRSGRRCGLLRDIQHSVRHRGMENCFPFKRMQYKNLVKEKSKQDEGSSLVS